MEMPTTVGTMPRTTLGRSGLSVSRLCFGTWQYGGDWGAQEEKDAFAAIHRARELGINFFDTAQGYGFGASERILGRALRDELRAHRADIVIATKGGLRPAGQGGVARDASPAWLREGAEDSLRALDVDVIDLYQVHWPDPRVPFAETAGALQDLIDEGKIRHVGVSNFDAGQMEEFSRTLPVETLQPPYHMFRREIEATILPYCRQHDIGVLAYGPLAHGMLGGRWAPDTIFPASDWRASTPIFRGQPFRQNLGVVEDLKRFATQRGYTVAQLAIAWVLANPAVEVAIVGARNAQQIDQTAPAAAISLSPDDLRQIDAILKASVPIGGPSPEAMPGSI